MELDLIFNHSSENMHEIPDKSVDLVVTSPPYNIDIQYGNKTVNGKISESKGVKYADNMKEEDYRHMLDVVFSECKRVVSDTGSIWINIKNQLYFNVLAMNMWTPKYKQCHLQ